MTLAFHKLVFKKQGRVDALTPLLHHFMYKFPQDNADLYRILLALSKDLFIILVMFRQPCESFAVWMKISFAFASLQPGNNSRPQTLPRRIAVQALPR